MPMMSCHVLQLFFFFSLTLSWQVHFPFFSTLHIDEEKEVSHDPFPKSKYAV